MGSMAWKAVACALCVVWAGCMTDDKAADTGQDVSQDQAVVEISDVQGENPWLPDTAGPEEFTPDARLHDAGETLVDGDLDMAPEMPGDMLDVGPELEAGETVETSPEDEYVCLPACENKQCGEDGCGGVCGLCGPLQECDSDATCLCKYVECGDGCCPQEDVCAAGQCCTPQCDGMACGDDGCSGSCGDCPGAKWCVAGQCQDLGLTWVPLPSNTYEMGCSPNDTECGLNEIPRHEVVVSAFSMLETEVTEGQFETVMGNNPSCNLGGSGGPTHPVECVTWDEARQFCELIGGRLPSEAEWEFAARAGATSKYSCGESSECLADIAWYKANAAGKKHAVKEKLPNGFGLYDTSGNVWEWVEDCWHWDYKNAPKNAWPAWDAWCFGTKRIRRGGGFTFDDKSILRVSFRHVATPDGLFSFIGFRCARTD